MEKILTTIWDGWNVTDKGIYSPEGQFFTPGEIRAITIQLALIAEYQTMDRLRRIHTRTGGPEIVHLNTRSNDNKSKRLRRSG